MHKPQHIARKRFGQNFLHDHAVIQAILANLQIQPTDRWVEIGPGQGALTQPLAKEARSLDIIELDRDLVALLKTGFTGQAHVRIHSADALKFDFSRLAENDNKLRIVGNLPYNISTPLLFHLLDGTSQIADMHFMLQKEVVDRICAVPGSKKYGRLSIMMQYHCRAESLFDVYPESFDPVPQVMSSIIRLIPHVDKPVAVNDKALFDSLVTQAFSQRRKTLRNALKTVVSEDVFTQANIDPVARAETVSIAGYANLANILAGTIGLDKH